MLSASFVARHGAPRVKGLRAALVLAKAPRFAVLDRAGKPALDTAPHQAKTLAFKKAFFLMAILARLFERVKQEKRIL